MRVLRSPNHFARALIFAGLAFFAAAALAAVPSERRESAVDAYAKAQRMRATLAAKAEGKRPTEEYKKVIDAYLEVHRLDTTYSKAPVALAAGAEIYQEMGREFSSDAYYLEAIKSFRYLIQQYPQNHISRGAQFTIAEIYRQDLEDPDAARRAYQDYITMYPKSDKAAEAREILNQLDAHPAAVANSSPASSPVERMAEEPPSALRLVTAVRRWVGANYLRIVIEVGGEAKFESVRLSNPDRIVVNVQNARLSRDLMGRTFPVEDGFLRQIRVAQFSPEVARVVLDVDKIESYSIFSLPNPFRLVIDVQGGTPTQIASTSKPVTPANADVRKQTKAAPPATANPATPPPTPPASVEVAAKTPPTTAPEVMTQPEPSAPAADGQEASVAPPTVNKPKKKSKDKTDASTTDGNPPIQAANPTESGSTTLTRALGLKIGRIVIDPGHGGHDTGTIGPTGLEEKDVVLDVGLKLRKLLERNTGCEVVMTRSDDTFIPLEERTAIANEKSADLFISIHANASRDDSARGIETYYLNFTSNPDALDVAARENASSQEAVHQLQDIIRKIAMTEKIEESQDFARLVQREVYSRVTKVSGAQRDRGIKKAPFVVLIGANMPSVLAEISFLTNPRDERLLKRTDYREKIAYALYEGILDYLKNVGEVRTVQRVASDQTTAAGRPDF
ncbi:MAG: N-acetylmuramoyl-L-alanine amidase [Terriglobia bacterium]